MKQIGARTYIKTYAREGWDLNLQVILGNQFNFVIDTGLGSESVAPLLPLLAQHPRPVVVVNTHHHWDHIWGNHCFSDSLIVAHRSCLELAGERWDEMVEQNAQHICGDVKRALPNLLFEQELYFPEDGIRLFYTPGHTLDGISVYDEREHILNAGDNIGDSMEELVPHVELPEAYRESLRRYESLEVSACVSGHNQVTDAGVFRQIMAQLDSEH